MSESKNQDDLLQQLQSLRAEKELLEKHVFVLNECLSVAELKTKISRLENKRDMLVSLENLIERIRTEIEPLSYLKSILKNKLEVENQIYNNDPSIKLKKTSIFDMDYTSIIDCKSVQSQGISKTSTKTNPVSSQILNDQLLDTNQTPCNSNLGSIVSDGSIDECLLLLDQYDVVTEHEMLNFSKENSDARNVNQHTNEIKDKLTVITSTYFDAEGLNVQSENEDKSVKTRSNYESTEQTEASQHIELPSTSNSVINIQSFNDMNLKLDILRGIYSLGLINPTVLQQRVIVQCLNGRDVIVFSGPNNGRTMLFTIPLLQRIKTNLYECQALVLVPTRDLAVHIQKIILSVGEFLGVNVCIGGDNVPRKLSVVPHVVVGTPAGVSNMIKWKSLRTGSIHTVVLNKVDMMLTRNYTVLIEEIMGKLVKNKQVTLLTSDKLDHVLDMYMDTLREPLVIIDDNAKEMKNKILKSLPKQFYLNIQEEWKMNALCEINETLNIQKAIIFCNTFDTAQKLYKSLQQLEYTVAFFHLEMNAHERETQLNMFSSNNLRMLIITTDPFKGSQFQHATWIINFDLPINPINYLDRIANCTENITVMNLINENDDHAKSAIETYNKSYMIQTPLNMIDLLQY